MTSESSLRFREVRPSDLEWVHQTMASPQPFLRWHEPLFAASPDLAHDRLWTGAVSQAMGTSETGVPQGLAQIYDSDGRANVGHVSLLLSAGWSVSTVRSLMQVAYAMSKAINLERIFAYVLRGYSTDVSTAMSRSEVEVSEAGILRHYVRTEGRLDSVSILAADLEAYDEG